MYASLTLKEFLTALETLLLDREVAFLFIPNKKLRISPLPYSPRTSPEPKRGHHAIPGNIGEGRLSEDLF
jgi:hypothetical protein